MSEPPARREIVRGLREGSRDAWNALCQQYSSRVWQYVARLIGSDTDAVADVFQETMLAVARSGRSLDEDARLWAWLARIAHNQAALHWRQTYRARLEPVNLDQLPTEADGPADLLGQAELVESIRRLLAEMDSDQVTLLTAKYLDGLSVAEIVAMVGGTTESVRSRLARARRDFRSRFEQLRAKQGSANAAVARKMSPGERD